MNPVLPFGSLDAVFTQLIPDCDMMTWEESQRSETRVVNLKDDTLHTVIASIFRTFTSIRNTVVKF